MAYFARDQNNRSPPRKQGIRVGGAVQIPPVKDVITRDQFIDQSIASMQPKDAPSGGGVLRFVGDSEDYKRRGRNPNHKPDSDIFGPPVQGKRPTPRIRAHVTDEELQRIWAEDEKKAQAAAHMERGSTLVDKMVADPVNPIIHSPRAKDAAPPPRRVINLMSETGQERSRQEFEPAGFSGMGSKCKIGPKQGVSCKPAEDYIPPELKARPRFEGRRTRFPKDTFSFQDDSQTLS